MLQEQIELVLSYAHNLWNKRWWMAGITWLVCSVGWISVYNLPDEYDVSARVYVDTRNLLKPLLRGLTIQGNSEQQIRLMERTLFSRPNLEKIVRMADLDLTVSDDAGFDQLITEVKKSISMRKDSKDNLYTIHYSDPDPEKAKRLVQAVLTTFVENTIGEARGDTAAAQRFIDKQIGEYERRLQVSENELKLFKQKNVAYLSESGSFYSRLKGEKGRLESSKLELAEAEQKRVTIYNEVEGEEPVFIPELAEVDEPTTKFDARIQNLTSQLDSLLLKYTEQHPNIISIKRTLADLESKKELELAEMDSGVGMSAAAYSGSNYYQQLKLTLSQLDASIASLKVRVKSYQERVDKLSGQVNTVPEVEAQLKSLNRDYGIVKKKHDELLVRREQAILSQQADQSSSEIKFRVIDPPRVPLEPTGPNRAIFASIVLVVGFIAGTGFAFVMGLVTPTFNSAFLLTQATGLQLLGTVSLSPNEERTKERKKQLIYFVALISALLGVYGVQMSLLLR
ncbi:MAG: hypothetical protein JKX83_06030 [Pseudomonadales bacterium]|nr:hypothetical protein [Pseudomonadales bacterium]